MATLVKVYGFGLSDGSGGRSKRDYVELDITVEIGDDITEEEAKDIIFAELRASGIRGMLRKQAEMTDKITVGFMEGAHRPERPRDELGHFKSNATLAREALQSVAGATFNNGRTARDPTTGRAITWAQAYEVYGIKDQYFAPRDSLGRFVKEVSGTTETLRESVSSAISAEGFKTPKARSEQQTLFKTSSEYQEEWKYD